MGVDVSLRLWPASLLVCGLFVGEDPTMVGVRSHVSGSVVTRIVLDLALASVMIAYNYASSRYVVSATSAVYVVDAMAVVDRQRAERVRQTANPTLRVIRHVVVYLNPFALLKRVGEHLGQSVDHLSASAKGRRLRRTAALLEDLGAVNFLGVPGATLALSSSGHAVSRRHSMRQCVLFVLSWFIGVRLIAAFIGALHALPVVGSTLRFTTGLIGGIFDLLTDITSPVGAMTIALMTLAIVRYARRVERVARAGSAGDHRLR